MKLIPGDRLRRLSMMMHEIQHWFGDHNWKLKAHMLYLQDPMTKKKTEYSLIELADSNNNNFLNWRERFAKDSGNELKIDKKPKKKKGSKKFKAKKKVRKFKSAKR